MNNDYLWDKTGDDAEVEQFEELLRGFRYVETEPPDLPATNIIHPRSMWQGRFGWILALGTTTAAVLLIGLYIKHSSVSPAAVQRQTAQVERPAPPQVVRDTTVSADLETVAAPAKTAPSYKLASAKRRVQRISPIDRTIAKRRAKLTDEERYAYNQVKLALFITGDKLRTVSDTINQIENKQNVSPNQR